MNKKQTITAIVLGGLLLKVIHNQHVLDWHIYEHQRRWEIDSIELLENNTLPKKIGRWIEKMFRKESN